MAEALLVGVPVISDIRGIISIPEFIIDQLDNINPLYAMEDYYGRLPISEESQISN